MNQKEYVKYWLETNATRVDADVSLGGISFGVQREVFSPDPAITNAIQQVVDHFPDVNGKRVLDLGTGCGVLALTAAVRGAREVLAIDIDPAAVRNALANCEALGVTDRVTVIEGDLFVPVSGKFDVILAALPILDSAWEEKGISVQDTFSRFFRGLDFHLVSGGIAYFCFASFGNHEGLKKAMEQSNRTWAVYEEEKFGVVWQLYESKPDNN